MSILIGRKAIRFCRVRLLGRGDEPKREERNFELSGSGKDEILIMQEQRKKLSTTGKKICRGAVHKLMVIDAAARQNRKSGLVGQRRKEKKNLKTKVVGGRSSPWRRMVSRNGVGFGRPPSARSLLRGSARTFEGGGYLAAFGLWKKR